MDLILNEITKFITVDPIYKLALIYIVYKIGRIDSKVDRHRRDWQSESKTMRHFFVPDEMKPKFDKMIKDKKAELERDYNDVKDFIRGLLVFLKALIHLK